MRFADPKCVHGRPRADTAEAIDMQTGKVLNAGDVKRITTRDLIKAIEAAG